QRSEPYLRYEMFTPRYIVLRDLDTFDLRENKQLGPFFKLRVSEGMPELGADFRAFGVAAAGGFAAGPAGSYLSLSASAGARYRHDGGRWIDQEAVGTFYGATPLVDRLFRIVAGVTVESKRADTTNTQFAIGGSTGLRGYAIGEFLGTSALIGHIEIRTASVSTLFAQRFGGLVFYDVGHAAPSLADLDLRNDVGLGLRWLAPQFNSTVLRFDWAVPLQDGVITRAGMPGRFSAGM